MYEVRASTNTNTNINTVPLGTFPWLVAVLSKAPEPAQMFVQPGGGAVCLSPALTDCGLGPWNIEVKKLSVVVTITIVDLS